VKVYTWNVERYSYYFKMDCDVATSLR